MASVAGHSRGACRLSGTTVSKILALQMILARSVIGDVSTFNEDNKATSHGLDDLWHSSHNRHDDLRM